MPIWEGVPLDVIVGLVVFVGVTKPVPVCEGVTEGVLEAV